MLVTSENKLWGLEQSNILTFLTAVDVDVSKNEIPMILVSDQNPDTAGTCAVF